MLTDVLVLLALGAQQDQRGDDSSCGWLRTVLRSLTRIRASVVTLTARESQREMPSFGRTH